MLSVYCTSQEDAEKQAEIIAARATNLKIDRYKGAIYILDINKVEKTYKFFWINKDIDIEEVVEDEKIRDI